MTIPAAVVRPIDRTRAARAILAFRQSDQLALNHVATEAAADENPESVAQLVLALTWAASAFLSSIEDGDAQLQRFLLNSAAVEGED